jgi:hypothetical protein
MMSFDSEFDPEEQDVRAVMHLHPRSISAEQMRQFEADVAAIFEAFGLDLYTPATDRLWERSRASNAQGAICFCDTHSQRRRQPYDQSIT